MEEQNQASELGKWRSEWAKESMYTGNCTPYLKRLIIITNVKIRYYEGGISSVYFWDLDDGFAGVVLLKKSKFSEL